MIPASAARTIRLSSAIVAVGWLVVIALGPEATGAGDPVSQALLLGIGALVPLGVTLLPAAPGPPSPLTAVLPFLVAPTSVAGATSLVLGVGPAGGLAACLWVTGALVLAFVGLGRILRALRSRERRVLEIGTGAALLSLPVGAAWLVMSRLGVDPLGVSSLIVLCTAVHFHFSSFCAVTLMLLALGRIEHPRGRQVLSFSIGASLVAIPLIAAGWSGVPYVIHVGVWLLAAAVIVYALTTLFLVVPRLRTMPGKILLGLSCLAPLASMPLAAMYVEARIDIDTMVYVHGILNAYVLVGLGLLAHLVEARQPATKPA